MEKLVKQNERMVLASSTPLLQFGHGNVTTEGSGDKSHPALTFAVENVGTGPARVVWFEVRHEGKPLRVFDDLTKALKPEGTLNMTNITAPIANTLMIAGEDRRIVLWNRPPDADAIGVETWKRVDKARWRLEVETCYCSLFDECWISNAQADVPKPVETCNPQGRISIGG